jgi:hypothetical protein
MFEVSVGQLDDLVDRAGWLEVAPRNQGIVTFTLHAPQDHVARSWEDLLCLFVPLPSGSPPLVIAMCSPNELEFHTRDRLRLISHYLSILEMLPPPQRTSPFWGQILSLSLSFFTAIVGRVPSRVAMLRHVALRPRTSYLIALASGAASFVVSPEVTPGRWADVSSANFISGGGIRQGAWDEDGDRNGNGNGNGRDSS